MTAMSYSGPPRRTTTQGKELLAAAVSIDWDWALPASSFDKLAEAIQEVSDDDLEAGVLLVSHLIEAMNCALLARDRRRRQQQAVDSAPNPPAPAMRREDMGTCSDPATCVRELCKVHSVGSASSPEARS